MTCFSLVNSIQMINVMSYFDAEKLSHVLVAVQIALEV